MRRVSVVARQRNNSPIWRKRKSLQVLEIARFRIVETERQPRSYAAQCRRTGVVSAETKLRRLLAISGGFLVKYAPILRLSKEDIPVAGAVG
jgi:hypothetical protein